jgi:hypothetical protein
MLYEYTRRDVPDKAVWYWVSPVFAGPDILEPDEENTELCALQMNWLLFEEKFTVTPSCGHREDTAR